MPPRTATRLSAALLFTLAPALLPAQPATDPETALQQYLTAIRAPGVRARTLNDLYAAAEASLEQKQYRDAEAAFRKLYQLEPLDLRGLDGIARVYLAEGRLDDAVAVVETELKRQPTRQDLLLCFADTAVKAGVPDRAVAALTAALHNNPRRDATARAELYRKLSSVNGQMADLPAALAAIRQSAALVPSDLRTLVSLAHILDASDKKSEALDTYRTITGVDPTDPAALIARAGTILEPDHIRQNGDGIIATTSAELAHQLRPDDPATTEVYARTEFRFDSYVSRALFEELVSQHPTSSEYHKFLALSHLQRSEFEPALAEFQEALKYAADDERAQIQGIIDRLTNLPTVTRK